MTKDQVTFGYVVGFVLAILFALVIGISMWALLVGEYMKTFMNEQTRHTVRIVGFAGVFTALVTWWVQNFAAKRGFLVRFMFAFFVFGGVLQLRRIAEVHLHSRRLSQPAGLVTDRDVSRLAERLLHIHTGYVLAAAPSLCRAHRGCRDLCRLVRTARGYDRRPLNGGKSG